MKYKFIIDYTPTDPQGATSQRECDPIYGDDLSVNTEMETDEWYRKRKLDGKLTFVRADYEYIMSCAFDGTFKLTIQGSTDSGASWQNYLDGTFSRANLEIDEDNKRATLNSLNEGGEYNIVENGKDEEYDLMKLIPDADARVVQGRIYPALAMVDWINSNISFSDVYCGSPFASGGVNGAWRINGSAATDASWRLMGVYTEAKVTMRNQSSAANGIYTSFFNNQNYMPYQNHSSSGGNVVGPVGSLRNNQHYWLGFAIGVYHDLQDTITLYASGEIYDNNGNAVPNTSYNIIIKNLPEGEFEGYCTPLSVTITPSSEYAYEKIDIRFHYIRAALLTATPELASPNYMTNVLNTSQYYKGMRSFEGSGLTVSMSRRTVNQPNGYRLVPGSGEAGALPEYFAPPDNDPAWIALAENNWTYTSMWYKITPSIANGLLDPTRIGYFQWSRCWTLGTCLDRLLRKITNNMVSFDQSVAGSEFLYSTVNPLTQGEPFEYLFTQKSNVMRPSTGGEGASRCIVRLDWFLEFLRNALNCHWWIEERNGGTYAFRVEHVEWFRRGGSYTGQMDAQFNLTKIKTRRNFLHNGEAAKYLDDQMHKYSYDMSGITEKYTFSWQGDGGSDAFKGNPMFFKAGWIEKGTSESHEVDNIFADLSWLMLNAGSDTESSKNYDGLFVFSGYLPATIESPWEENSHSTDGGLIIANNISAANIGVCITVPLNESARLRYRPQAGGAWSDIIFEGTGEPQYIHVHVPLSYDGIYLMYSPNAILHRVQTFTGSIYNIPNTANLLSPDPANPTYLQNGPLAWPWLQNEYLHYDIPAKMWGYNSDDIDTVDWEPTGTVKLRKKQEVPLLPLPTKNDEVNLEKGVIGGLRDSNNQLQVGIVKSATINLGTRNAKLTLMYDIIS